MRLSNDSERETVRVRGVVGRLSGGDDLGVITEPVSTLRPLTPAYVGALANTRTLRSVQRTHRLRGTACPLEGPVTVGGAEKPRKGRASRDPKAPPSSPLATRSLATALSVHRLKL